MRAWLYETVLTVCVMMMNEDVSEWNDEERKKDCGCSEYDENDCDDVNCDGDVKKDDVRKESERQSGYDDVRKESER